MSNKKPVFRNLIEAHEYSIHNYADSEAYGTKVNGKYEWMTYREYGELVANVRGGLAHYGVGKEDCVAIIADNCTEWAASAYATYGLEARFTPMYEKQLEKDWKYIVADSQAKVVIVRNYAIYDVVKDWIEELPHLEYAFILDADESDKNSYKHLISVGKANPVPNNRDIDPDQICGLIYTSGTTGDPKGVMLTHRNICSNVNAVETILEIEPGYKSLCFLPWAHVFGQTVELHIMSSVGAGVAFVESIDKIIDNLAEVKPDVLVSVPRIFNRIYAGVQKMMSQSGGLKQTLFNNAIKNSDSMREEKKKKGKVSLTTSLKDKFYDKLVLSKVRQKFGGNLKFCISGGAALSPEVARFIDNLHIAVYEGYGLTETAPIVTVNRPYAKKIGSIGIPLPDVEVKTAPADGYDEPNVGEICVRGPNVMKGYWKLPEQTDEVIDEDGWFHTGDLGRIDKDGFVWVIGRVKEQYKLENGKYVVPVPLEEKIQLSKYILQAVIEGANRRYNTALFVLDMTEVKPWAEENGIAVDDKIFENQQLHDLIREEVEELSSSFKGYEKPKKWILCDKEMTVENGMLTPSLKVKRREVMKHYGDQFAALYSE